MNVWVVLYQEEVVAIYSNPQAAEDHIEAEDYDPSAVQEWTVYDAYEK